MDQSTDGSTKPNRGPRYYPKRYRLAWPPLVANLAFVLYGCSLPLLLFRCGAQGESKSNALERGTAPASILPGLAAG